MLIKNVFASKSSPIQAIVENLFNQFIENLNIPMEKFTQASTSSMLKSDEKQYNSIRVTLKHLNNIDYDDDYIDFEEFERWSSLNMNQNKMPSLE